MKGKPRKQVAFQAIKGILLDTDVLINILKHLPGYPSLLYKSSQPLYYASISKKELYRKRGLTRSEARAISTLLSKLRKVEPDHRILKHFDFLLFKYRNRGLLKADALIASTAWAKSLILITGNKADFSFIEEIKISSPIAIIQNNS